MKREALLLMIMLGYNTMVDAQQKIHPPIELLVKGGVNLNGQNSSIIEGKDKKGGYNAGVAVNIPFKDSGFSIQPEINFVSKGTKVTNKAMREMFFLNYIEIPVLAKFTVDSFYLNAGPSVGFLTWENAPVNRSYKTQSLDFGLQFGIGFNIHVGYGNFIIDTRYNLGLSNISESSNVKNKDFLLSFGYSIPL